jgi:YhcN/YlaJ family sporulation lipoprotein
MHNKLKRSNGGNNPIMITTKNSLKGIVITFAAVTIIASGCTSKVNNQVKQQAVPRMQTKQQAAPRTQTQNQTRPKLTNVNNRIQIANQAAKKIVHLPGVKQANVLVMRRNAFVAALVDAKHDPITKKMKDRIAQQVRKTDPNIHNVYVSTNPEFVNRINRYVTDVQQGRPVSGFFAEFSNMIRNVFPTAR